MTNNAIGTTIEDSIYIATNSSYCITTRVNPTYRELTTPCCGSFAKTQPIYSFLTSVQYRLIMSTTAVIIVVVTSSLLQSLLDRRKRNEESQ